MFPLKDDNQARSLPIITWLLIVANILVFLGEASLSRPELNAAIHLFGFVPARFWQNMSSDEVLTMFSAMFMHAGLIHVISNMWMLYIFGDNVEDRLGHVRFFFFYLICGVFAFLTQSFLGADAQLPTIGASGAIAGVLGGYIMFYPKAKIITLIPLGFIPIFVKIPAFFFLGVWFLSQAFSGWHALDSSHLASEAGGVAWWAHIGGFILGAILVNMLVQKDYQRFYKDEYYPY